MRSVLFSGHSVACSPVSSEVRGWAVFCCGMRSDDSSVRVGFGGVSAAGVHRGEVALAVAAW